MSTKKTEVEPGIATLLYDATGKETIVRGLPFTYNDGGRAAAGFRGDAGGDCVCRAVAVASRRPYLEIYNLIAKLALGERPRARNGKRSTPRSGVFKGTSRRLMDALGFQWVSTMGIGTGCSVHLREGELPKGRLVVSVSRHLVAVVDGVTYDTADPSRGGTRCVYGYWVAPEEVRS